MKRFSQKEPFFPISAYLSASKDLRIQRRHVPYHRALISEAETEAVVATLKSGWLTTGPRTKEFEERFSAMKGGYPAIGVQSCTAGLFLAVKSLGLKPGDEVITTPMSFVATSNVVLQHGGSVVFADVQPETMNIDPEQIEARITPRTRALLPVHVGGNPCDMDRIMRIAEAHGLKVIEDCAHSIEGEFMGKPLGTFGHASAFSFYPTKNMTTGEGGMVLCKEEEVAREIRLLSGHGIAKNTWQRMEVEHDPLYDVLLPGYKCNMSDLQAALGLVQLDKLAAMYARRVAIKAAYDRAFDQCERLRVIQMNRRGKSALHLYLVLLDLPKLSLSRNQFIAEARRRGVELSVNYSPIHLFTYYRETFGYEVGDFPIAEACGASVISLPFYPAMTDEDVEYVSTTLLGILEEYSM